MRVTRSPLVRLPATAIAFDEQVAFINILKEDDHAGVLAARPSL
jgi:hypothetical protein